MSFWSPCVAASTTSLAWFKTMVACPAPLMMIGSTCRDVFHLRQLGERTDFGHAGAKLREDAGRKAREDPFVLGRFQEGLTRMRNNPVDQHDPPYRPSRRYELQEKPLVGDANEGNLPLNIA
jgi:hypothetical protein